MTRYMIFAGRNYRPATARQHGLKIRMDIDWSFSSNERKRN